MCKYMDIFFLFMLPIIYIRFITICLTVSLTNHLVEEVT